MEEDTIVMASPGAIIHHQPRSRAPPSKARRRIDPQLWDWGSPNPRKLIAASARMALPNATGM